MILNIMFYSLLFITLASVASFLTVIGHRTIKKEPLILSRSHCDGCQKKLNAIALIPIFGFLYYSGKCYYCKRSINWYYPTFEVIYALTTMLIIYLQQDVSMHITIFSILFIMSATDMLAQIVPDRFQIILLTIILINLLKEGSSPHFWLSLLFSIFMLILLTSLSILTQGGMGGADIKLFTILALFFNWQYSFLIILISCILVLIFIAINRFKTRDNRSIYSGVPLVPFVTVAYPITLLYMLYI